MKRIGFVFVILALSGGLAFAAPYTFPGVGIKLDTPKGWTATVDDAGDTLSISSPDNLVNIVFIPVEGEQLEEALTAAMTQIATDVPDVEFGETGEYTVNGMDAIEVPGTGTLSGVNVDISTTIVINKGPVIVIAYTILPDGSKYDKVLETFVKSIKKM